jgi:hypothetical protein
MMVKLDEIDTACIAADRPGFCAEAAGSPTANRGEHVPDGPHVFLALSQIDQAHHVTNSIAQASNRKSLAPRSPKILRRSGAPLEAVVRLSGRNCQVCVWVHIARGLPARSEPSYMFRTRFRG